MANVEIITFTKIKEIIGKKKFYFETNSIEELLESFFEKYGDVLKEEILDSNGNLKKHYRILVNGRNINILDGFQTKLNDGDMVALIPAIAGGN